MSYAPLRRTGRRRRPQVPQPSPEPRMGWRTFQFSHTNTSSRRIGSQNGFVEMMSSKMGRQGIARTMMPRSGLRCPRKQPASSSTPRSQVSSQTGCCRRHFEHQRKDQLNPGPSNRWGVTSNDLPQNQRQTCTGGKRSRCNHHAMNSSPTCT